MGCLKSGSGSSCLQGKQVLISNYIFRQERSLKGRQRTGLAVSFTQMRLQMNRRQQEGQIFVDIAALRC